MIFWEIKSFSNLFIVQKQSAHSTSLLRLTNLTNFHLEDGSTNDPEKAFFVSNKEEANFPSDSNGSIIDKEETLLGNLKSRFSFHL